MWWSHLTRHPHEACSTCEKYLVNGLRTTEDPGRPSANHHQGGVAAWQQVRQAPAPAGEKDRVPLGAALQPEYWLALGVA
jgi:hypothetical protein